MLNFNACATILECTKCNENHITPFTEIPSPFNPALKTAIVNNDDFRAQRSWLQLHRACTGEIRQVPQARTDTREAA